MDNRKKQKQIHRNGAELKWKVPQIVDPVSYRESKRQLLPDFAAQHKKSEQEKEPVGRTAEKFFSVCRNGVHVSASIIL